MTYRFKSIYLTLQGEGAQQGRPAVFLRFTGCNLWSGREADRQSAVCRFCDTDFLGTDGPGGGVYENAADIAQQAAELWPHNGRQFGEPLVVCTGGEPLLQLDEVLIEALHERGFEVAVETNGTRPIPAGVDWVCVSPKANAPLVVTGGDELKLVYPQEGIDPADLLELDFDHFFLQPMDGPAKEANTDAALEYCLHHPEWSLSVQMHKVLGIS